MDGDDIPLSCEITPSNTNEQKILKPLEEKIINDFDLAEIVVCINLEDNAEEIIKVNHTLGNRRIIQNYEKRI